MKKYIVLILIGFMTLFTGIAAFGGLANQRLKTNQNIYGGYGELRTMETSRCIYCPYLYDDTYIYSCVRTEIAGNICAIDRRDGKGRLICNRPLCGHDTEDCRINQLCWCGNPDYMFMDGDLYYYRTKGKKNVLYKLDEFNGHSTALCEFPAEIEMTDAEGNTFPVTIGISVVKRMSEKLISVETGNGIYLLNNDFRILERLPNMRFAEFVYTEEQIYGCRPKEIFRYSVREKAQYDNIIEAAGCSDAPSVYDYYADGDLLYVGIKNHICALNAKTNVISELVEYDPGNCFQRFLVYEDTIYYLKDGLYVYNLQTKENVRIMDDVPIVPTIIEDTLLIYEEDGFHLYSMDGKKLW